MTSKASKASPEPVKDSGVIKLNPRLREAFDNFVSTWIDTMNSMSIKERETVQKICEQRVRNVLQVPKKKPKRPKKKRRR